MSCEQESDFTGKPAGNLAYPLISVVIPVRDEERTVGSVITSLLDQEYPQDCLEIIVCDGYSTDETYERVQKIAEQESRVTLLRNEGRLSSCGRNLGYRNARGDIILYVDGHCVIPDRHLLQSVAELFSTTGCLCLSRPQPLIPDEDSGIQAAAIATVRTSRFGHSRSSYIFADKEGFVSPVSAGAMYKRDVFEKIGEFDESFDAGEDLEFNTRVRKAGFTSFISPRLKILYHARSDLWGLFRQMKRYGRGRFALLKKHPDAFEWQMVIPVMFVVMTILALLVLAFVPPLRWSLLVVAVIAYASVLALVSSESGRFGRRGWPLYPFAFFAIYWGLGVGFIQAAFANAFSEAVRIGPDRPRRDNAAR